MEREMVMSGQSSKPSTPRGSISILVVDDDTTCLSIVAAILKSWKYEVVTVKHAVDALCTLRIKEGLFDLVVTDVHMPDMNGFELQKQIKKEFKLPVVFMSADDKDSLILEGLQSGAAFFIVKPITPADLKNLWQYAVAKKKGKAVVEETVSVQEMVEVDHKVSRVEVPMHEMPSANKAVNEVIASASSVNEDREGTKDAKRKSARKDSVGKRENKDNSSTPKKIKVIWTNALHNQFLEAVRSIGLERAVPKKILELMNVPGLTRENVASHLQKYRIFLKRVSEASCRLQSAAERSLAEKSFASAFSPGQPLLTYNRSRHRYLQELEKMQMGTTSSLQKLGGQIPALEAPSLGHSSSSNWEASASCSIPRGGYGQSCLLSNRGKSQPLLIGSANNPSGLLVDQNNTWSMFPLHGDASSSLMGGTNVSQIPENQSEIVPRNFANGLSKYNFSTSVGGSFGDPNGFLGKTGSSNNFNSYNYAGFRLASDGRLVGFGYSGCSGTEISANLDRSNALMNGTQGPILSGNSGHNLAQVVISSGGLECQNYISTALSNNPIQQGSNTLPPWPTPLNPSNFSNEGNGDYIFSLLDNHAGSDSSAFLSHCGNSDLSSSQINFLLPNQPQNGEPLNTSFSFSSFHVGDDSLVNKQALEKQQGGEELVNCNHGINWDQLEEYFPLLDQSSSQQDEEDFLKSVLDPSNCGGGDNLGDR